MQFDDGPDGRCFQSPRNPSNLRDLGRAGPEAFCAATNPITTVAEDRDLVGSGGGMLQAGWRF
jgi:hypothetical protein